MENTFWLMCSTQSYGYVVAFLNLLNIRHRENYFAVIVKRKRDEMLAYLKCHEKLASLIS